MKVFSKTDFWLGVIVILCGFYALFSSLGFDKYSKSYPLFLSVFHVIIGIGIVLNSVKEISSDNGSLKNLFNQIRGPLSVVSILIFWGVLINIGVGYFLTSIIAMPSILYMLGYHNIKKVIAGSIGIVGVVFLLFYVLFDVPLPLNPYIEKLLG